MAQRRNCALEVIWVPPNAGDDTELDAMLAAAASRISHIIKTIYLASGQSPPFGNLVVIGVNLFGRLNSADQLIQPQRCTIAVQGTSVGMEPSAIRPVAKALS
jgi:hypothetical protein